MIFCRSNCTSVDTFWTNFMFWYAIVSVIIGISRTAWIARNPDKVPFKYQIDQAWEVALFLLYYSFLWPLLCLGWLILPKDKREWL